MVFDPACEEQKKQFFRQGYGAHLPGWVHVLVTYYFQSRALIDLVCVLLGLSVQTDSSSVYTRYETV